MKHAYAARLAYGLIGKLALLFFSILTFLQPFGRSLVLICMMSGIWTMLWLAGEVVDVLVFFWPISVFLGIHLVFAAAFAWLRDIRAPLLALMVPFVWPVIVLMIAGSGWQMSSHTGISVLPIAAVEIIAVVQFLLSVGIIYQLKGQRWLATAVCMVAGWLGIISSFIAGMALSETWI